MIAYLSGDRTVEVSPAFAHAVSQLGQATIDVRKLAYHERQILAKLDLRWQAGPDGVLMWVPQALSRATHPQSVPDFSWLQEAAASRWFSQQVGQKAPRREPPAWVVQWALEWSEWGHRYLSVVWDNAYKEALRRRIFSPFKAAGRAALVSTQFLNYFLLEYLPNCSIGISHPSIEASGSAVGNVTHQERRWPLPKQLLDPASHDHGSGEIRDDFWNRGCSSLGREFKSKTRVQEINLVGASRSLEVQVFLDFVALRLSAAEKEAGIDVAPRYRCPFLPRTRSSTLVIRDKDGGYAAPLAKYADKSCSWISREHPHLREWEPFAADFVGKAATNVPNKIAGVIHLFDRYLAIAGKKGTAAENLDPAVAIRPIPSSMGSKALLLRAFKDSVPNTIEQWSDQKMKGSLREARAFIEHILNFYCSDQDDTGTVRLKEFHNPFSLSDLSDESRTAAETVRMPMPYRWIRLFRGILVEGPNFSDWRWAQRAQQSERGDGADWFEVDERLIDKADPDCVWRMRTTGEGGLKQRIFYELWSPVRWVALLAKLNTALRTVQVRVLDSGESDSHRFDLKAWARSTVHANTVDTSANHTLAAHTDPWITNNLLDRNPILHKFVTGDEHRRSRGGKRDPQGWNNGALRRIQSVTEDGHRFDTVLYINTNKTADAKREGAAKGFEVPWPLLNCPMNVDELGNWIVPSFSSEKQKAQWLRSLSENTHWWLAKLRDWQEKYNPIARRLDWRELSGTGIFAEKTDEQYEMYRPACFLFREPAMSKSGKHPGGEFPLPDSVVVNAWWALNRELQVRFAAEGKSIRLVKDEMGETKACTFDLHSIRVSLITALVRDGKVPIEIVQRLVGHSRLVMTIYYTRVLPHQMAEGITLGMQRLEEKEEEQEKKWLMNASAEEVRAKAAFNDEKSALAALGVSQSPARRPVLAWIHVPGGICPVGCAETDTEGGLAAGCFNGGPVVSQKGSRTDHGPVEGGSRSCPNCRWFITTPKFIPELWSRAEVASYERQEYLLRTDAQYQLVQKASDALDAAAATGASRAELAKLERSYEQSQDDAEALEAQAAIAVVTMGNIYRLIYRCVDIANGRPAEGMSADDADALVMSGGSDELKVIVEETTSEMLQVARVSQISELFPELNPRKAILRASQILAKKLATDGVDPWLLLDLSEEVQRKIVNEIMRHVSRVLDPRNDELGFRKAVKLIESKESIADVLGIKKNALPDWVRSCAESRTEGVRLGTVIGQKSALLMNEPETQV